MEDNKKVVVSMNKTYQVSETQYEYGQILKHVTEETTIGEIMEWAKKIEGDWLTLKIHVTQ